MQYTPYFHNIFQVLNYSKMCLVSSLDILIAVLLPLDPILARHHPEVVDGIAQLHEDLLLVLALHLLSPLGNIPAEQSTFYMYNPEQNYLVIAFDP